MIPRVFAIDFKNRDAIKHDALESEKCILVSYGGYLISSFLFVFFNGIPDSST